MGKIVLILGIVGALLGGVVLLVSIMLPVLTDGRTSWEEAMFGIIPGALILVCSAALAAVGVVILISKRKKTLP